MDIDGRTTSDQLFSVLLGRARASYGRDAELDSIAGELRAMVRMREPDAVDSTLDGAAECLNAALRDGSVPRNTVLGAWRLLNGLLVDVELNGKGLRLAQTARRILGVGDGAVHVLRLADAELRLAVLDTLVALGDPPAATILENEREVRSALPARWLRLALPEYPMSELERMIERAIEGDLSDGQPATSRLGGADFAGLLSGLRQKCEGCGQDFAAVAQRLTSLLPEAERQVAIERGLRNYRGVFEKIRVGGSDPEVLQLDVWLKNPALLKARGQFVENYNRPLNAARSGSDKQGAA